MYLFHIAGQYSRTPSSVKRELRHVHVSSSVCISGNESLPADTVEDTNIHTFRGIQLLPDT